MIEKQPRIALLIDADNAPAAKIDVILAELAKLGVANIRRAYGNWKKDGLKSWEAVLHDHAIRPIQQFDYSKGKNATDMGMVIDAMDLLYTDEPDAYGIVSSDSDFTPLVLHLKAKGATVFGFGAKKTPLPFVNACSRFLYLEQLGTPVEPDDAERPAKASAALEPKSDAVGKPAKPARKRRGGKTAEPPAAEAPPLPPAALQDSTPVDLAPPVKRDTAALRQDARLVTLLRNVVETAAGEDGWAALGAVAQQIGNQASFDPRNHGYRKLIDLIDATQLFDLDRRGTQFVLRDKRVARAGRP